MHLQAVVPIQILFLLLSSHEMLNQYRPSYLSRAGPHHISLLCQFAVRIVMTIDLHIMRLTISPMALGRTPGDLSSAIK